jgi:hypothetical protein
MNENDRAEQSPCAALPIDVEHSKDLKKANASNGARCEHLAVAAKGQHHHRGHHDDEICGECKISFNEDASKLFCIFGFEGFLSQRSRAVRRPSSIKLKAKLLRINLNNSRLHKNPKNQT